MIQDTLTDQTAAAALAVAVTPQVAVAATLPDFAYSLYTEIFSVYNNVGSYGRGVVNAIWIDNLFQGYIDGYINKKQNKLKFQLNHSTTSQVTAMPFTIDAAGYNSKSVSVNINSTLATAAAATQIRLLSIGDSYTANSFNKRDGSTFESWGFPSRAILNAIKDAYDQAITQPGHLLLGKLNLQTRSVTYNGNTFTFKGYNEGQGGRSACNFLRHAIMLTGSGTNGVGVASGISSWGLLGLNAVAGAAFTGTDAQKELIRTTLQGKNPHDYNSDVWDFCKIQTGWTGTSGAWVDNPTNRGYIDTWIAAKYANPDIPFFSLTKAQTGGSTASFSLTSYLSKYKTLANDGVTRLTVGSTAGSQVANAATSDVCTPTHISLNLGTNDFAYFAQSIGSQAAADLKAIADIIKAEYPAIKVAMLANPYPGTLFPERYDGHVLQQRNASGNIKRYDEKVALIGLVGSLASQKTAGLYYVPTFETFYPLSKQSDRSGYDTVGSEFIINNPIEQVHPGLDGMSAIGDQLYAWIYYTQV